MGPIEKIRAITAISIELLPELLRGGRAKRRPRRETEGFRDDPHALSPEPRAEGSGVCPGDARFARIHTHAVLQQHAHVTG